MSKIFIIISVIAVVILKSAIYIVGERELAIKLQLGEIVSVETIPGLKFNSQQIGTVHPKP